MKILLALLGLLVGHDESWVEVAHRQLPLAFEVPATASLQRTFLFSLARPRIRDRGPVEVDLFGIRPLPGNSAAVQFGFYWITPDFVGATSEALGELPEQLTRPQAVATLLGAVFFEGLDVRMADLGADFAAGRPARRVRLSRTIARGTRQERQMTGEAFVIPVDGRAALVVIARFDPQASAEERGASFARVLHTLRIGAAEHLEPSRSAHAGEAAGLRPPS